MENGLFGLKAEVRLRAGRDAFLLMDLVIGLPALMIQSIIFHNEG